MSQGKIFVSGLVNVESTIKVPGFPIEYCPIEYLFNGISTNVSGVGYNVSKALATLGDEVHLHTIVGNDGLGHIIKKELSDHNIGIEGVYHTLDATPQSIIMYDPSGQRKIYCDLKNIQESTFPTAFTYDIDYDLAVLTNVNFSRCFFDFFKERNIPIATDCHVLTDVNSKYDKEFLENANIIFMSNDGIRGKEYDFMKELINTYNQEIIVITMGSQGAIMYDRFVDDIFSTDAITVRPIVNTVGAGDAFFSSFLHFYTKKEEPIDCLHFATYFASYKIGANGGAEGFLREEELFQIMKG